MCHQTRKYLCNQTGQHGHADKPRGVKNGSPAHLGGSGSDTINSDDGRVTVRCGPGTDRLNADPGDVLIGCEIRV
jgi:hypothetical protein